MDLLAVAGGAARSLVALTQETGGQAGLTINLFWIVVSAGTFIVFLAIIWLFAFEPISRMLGERRARIEEGLRDAEQARRDREQAQADHAAALQEARREANDIINRAQRVAQESREADIAATREELGRMRERAAAEIEAEKQRAIADLRAEVAGLALEAAGKVVGESMTDERNHRLVEDFLRETAAGAGSEGGR
ncbi:MAG TPA: F0F1 ATP synthase subunit B [Candidatus Limnocylindrales bacterium]